MDEANLYEKKPVRSEAIQFVGDNMEQVSAFVGLRTFSDRTTGEAFVPIGTYIPVDYEGDDSVAMAELWMDSNKAWVPVTDGEWIIKDDKGFYPCLPDVFSNNYWAVDDLPSASRMHLPVAVPGNNPHPWEVEDGIVEITRQGGTLRFRNEEVAEVLHDMARKGILLELNFAYKKPVGDFEKINRLYSGEYHDEDTLMKTAEAIRSVVGDEFEKIQEIVQAMQNKGILFRERC